MPKSDYFNTMLAFASAFALMGKEEKQEKKKEKVDIRKEISNMHSLFKEYNLIKNKQSKHPRSTREAQRKRVENMEVVPYCNIEPYIVITRDK